MTIATATLDAALALYRGGQLLAARAMLTRLVERDPGSVTAWNMLGYVNRDLGEASAAALAFDHVLLLYPGDPTALNGRARLALERGEADVLDRYRAALAGSPGDPRLILEQTEARLSRGDAHAVDDFARVVATAPHWSEGQMMLARMRCEVDPDSAWAEPILAMLRRSPAQPDLWRQLIDLLAGCDRFAEAADTARAAFAAVPHGDEFALLEAIHAGRIGDLDRAAAAFDQVPVAFPGKALHVAIHLLRLGQLDRAREMLGRVIAASPDDVSAWSVLDLVYRATGDRRAAWLAAQPGLVQVLDLGLDPADLAAVTRVLHDLHRNGVQMLGQSVRGGIQTRWRLFDRLEPELAVLRRALDAATTRYVANLPPVDDTHPLLRYRDAPLMIEGSWSVRLTGDGHHVSHVHPLGLISSACYFAVPDAAGPGEGQLELGRPPADLQLDLAPLHVIAPQPGRLVLFPSYLHHGTTPFSAGERMSVAFDIVRRPVA